jgi:hypothetical protein
MTEFTNPPKTPVQRTFFVPAFEESSADSFEAWRTFARDAGGGITNRKVQRIVYSSNGQEFVSEVGYREHDGTAAWLVTAILEPSGPKGPNSPWRIHVVRFPAGKMVHRTPPIEVSQSNVINVLDFLEPEEKPGDDGEGGNSNQRP